MATTSESASTNIGHVTQVIGSTFDAKFEEGNLPAIYNAVKIHSNEKGVELNLTGEIQQHLGGGNPQSPLSTHRAPRRYEGG